MLTASTRRFLMTGSLEGHEELDHSDVALEAESVGDILTEVREAVESYDSLMEEHDILLEAHAAVEGYVDLLNLGLENGGITPMTAHAVRLGLESWERKLGLEESLVPAVESFGGTSSQEHATQVSLESASDMLKKLWEGLKNMLKFIAEKVVELGKTISNGAFRLSNRAQKVAAKAKDVKGQPKNTNIEVQASAISADGDVLTVDQITAFAKAVGVDFPAATNSYVSGIAGAASGLDPKAENFYEGLGKVVDRLGDYSLSGDFEAVSATEVSKRWPDAQAFRTKQIMPGNKAFYVVLPSKELAKKGDNGKSIISVIGKVNAGVYPVQGVGSSEGKRNVRVLGSSELQSGALKIAESAKQIADMSNKASMKKALDEIKKTGEAITTKGAGDDTAANSAALVIKALTHTKKLLHGPSTKGLGVATSALAGQLRLIEQQLAQYVGGAGTIETEGGQAALPAPQA